MSVLGAAEQDRADVVTVEITVPRPSAAAPSSVAAGSSPADGYGRRAAGQRRRPAGAHSPASAGRAPGHRDLHVRQVRVSEMHVRELRTEERQQGESGAREVRLREARSLTVRAREVQAREVQAREARVVVPGGGPLGGRRPRAAAAAARSGSGRAGRVRLTRRGRIVLACLAIMVATAVATAMLFWLSAVGGAQAASHGQRAVVAHRGLHQVVVRPGETLWSIARQAEPSADPRIVVQQIIEVNALSGPMIQAGELLWVPRG